MIALVVVVLVAVGVTAMFGVAMWARRERDSVREWHEGNDALRDIGA